MRIERIKSYRLAAKSVLLTAPQLVHTEPRSAFRKAAVASLVYAGQLTGENVGPKTQRKIAWFIESSVVFNNFFDEGQFDIDRYAETVRNTIFEGKNKNQLNETDAITFFEFTSLLEKVETSRPRLDQSPTYQDVKQYREASNLVNLAAVCSMAFSKKGFSLSSFLVQENGTYIINPNAPSWFTSLFYSTMALQVIDDIVGIQGDLNFQRPSFFTGHISEFGSNSELLCNREQIVARMKGEFEQYCKLAEKKDLGFYTALHPLLHLGLLYPAMTELSVKTGIRFPGLTSSRDMNDKKAILRLQHS